MVRAAFLARCAAAVLIAAITAAPPAAAESVSVTFVLVNDIDRMSGRDGRGGLARLASVVARERATRQNVFFVHAGDTISPSLLSGFDQGEHMIELTNMLAPDYFVPGNHEFDFGPEAFLARMAEARFQVLAANLRGPDNAPVSGIGATAIVDTGVAEIGIVGLTSDESPVKSRPGDLKFTPAATTGITSAEALRAGGVDLVVAVAHTNRAQDMEMFRSGAFDVILSGDDHDLMLVFDGRTVMAESKQDAEFVTAIDLAIEVTEEDGRRNVTWWPSFRVIDTAGVEPDPRVAARVAVYEARLSAELDVTIARTLTELDSRRPAVRGGESAIGNLVADAMRQAVGADAAIINGGGIRGNRVYPAGSPITRRDILAELPFGNRTVLIEVTGATIADALENGVSALETGSGRFPQVSGIGFTLDPAAALGRRVSAISIAGRPLDPDATYRLATNDFMAAGGDGYGVLRSARVVIGARDARLLAGDVMGFIAGAGEIAPVVEGRIRVK